MNGARKIIFLIDSLGVNTGLAVLNLPLAVNFLHVLNLDMFLPYVAWWTLDCCEKCI